MKKLLLLAIPLLLGTCPLPEAKWVRIFDGKTLNGWTPKITGRALGEDPKHMFVVHDGAIRVSHANTAKFEGEFGHLFWKTPVGAYRVRLEYRLFGDPLLGGQSWQVSNSGIMIHSQAPETMSRAQDFPVSLEVQFLGTPRPAQEPTGNLCTPGTNVVIEGERVHQHCIHSTGPTLSNGQWVRAEVEILPNGQVTHFINGKPVMRYSDPELDPTDKDAQPLIAAADGKLTLQRGYLALQSEGHQIEFRNIELLTLD